MDISCWLEKPKGMGEGCRALGLWSHFRSQMGKAGQGNSKWCCEAVSLLHPVVLICSQVVTKGHLLALCGISVLANKCVGKITPKQLGLPPVLSMPPACVTATALH